MSEIYSQLHGLSKQQLLILAEKHNLENATGLSKIKLVKLLMGECIDCDKPKKNCKTCGGKKSTNPDKNIPAYAYKR